MSDTVSPLLMLDLEGLSVSPVEKDMLAHPGAGGLILFTRNYQDRQQLAELVRQIREIRPDMLIAVDQAGPADHHENCDRRSPCWPHNPDPAPAQN